MIDDTRIVRELYTVASKIIGANQKINKYENIFETNKIKI